MDYSRNLSYKWGCASGIYIYTIIYKNRLSEVLKSTASEVIPTRGRRVRNPSKGGGTTNTGDNSGKGKLQKSNVKPKNAKNKYSYPKAAQ